MKRARGENPNSFFALCDGLRPIIDPEATLNAVELESGYLYDLPTEAGATYHLIGK